MLGAEGCTSYYDFMFYLVNELFECFFDSVVSFDSGLLNFFVGADEGMGVVGL